MKSLTAHITQKNQWNALFGGEVFQLDTHAGRQRVADSIDAALSPENLTCDGELPRAEVQKRYRALTAAANELKRLDPSVTMYVFENA
jgi:hypothetical protein